MILLIIFTLKVLNIVFEASELSVFRQSETCVLRSFFRRNAEIPLFLKYNFPSKPVYYLSYSKGSYDHVAVVPQMENTDETFQVLFASGLTMYYAFVHGMNNLQ